MNHFFCLHHAPEDDLAPMGLPPSAREGRRRAQSRPIQPENAASQPPVDEYGIPENPYTRQEPPQAPPVRRRRAERNLEQPAPSFASQSPQPSAPRFDAPASPEIPDWLRVAQQNKTVAYARPQGPTVQPAPRQAVSYPPPRADMQPPPAPMPRAYTPQPNEQPVEDWQVETDEETVSRELPAWIRKVPWLGIAAFAVIAVAVALWIMGMSYDRQTARVLEERAAREARMVEAHPLRYQEIITQKADRYNLNPAFVAAIMLNESSFRPDATNGSTGARGLMQLVHDTAEWVHGKLNDGTAFTFDAMYEPERNAEYGCWYLNYLSNLFHGDPVLVASAFHAGQGEVRNWLNTADYSPDGRTIAIDRIPFGNTRRYVGRVIDDFATYLRIYYGR